jgi:hypothetical protein
MLDVALVFQAYFWALLYMSIDASGSSSTGGSELFILSVLHRLEAEFFFFSFSSFLRSGQDGHTASRTISFLPLFSH